MANVAIERMCEDNFTDIGTLYQFGTSELWAQWTAIMYYFEYQPWIFSLIGSAMVGLTGIFPLLIIPIQDGDNLKNGASAGLLKILLSFAVGGLLGDVFLHLLPEAWSRKQSNIVETEIQRPAAWGLWVLAGFLVFIIAEKIFIGDNEEKDREEESPVAIGNDDGRNKNCERDNNNVDKVLDNNNCPKLNGGAGAKLRHGKNLPAKDASATIDKSGLNEARDDRAALQNILAKSRSDSRPASSVGDPTGNGFAELSRTSANDNATIADVSKENGKHIAGYLNLLANCIDNFTHGLAVGGSFLVSFRLGALTTFAILIHEIPHEIGDFAILLKSGFNRWDAARAQLLTASGGILGAFVAVAFSGSGIESRTSWILPFTAGGFLHIGMVTILPELLKEINPKESIKQLGALLSGITVMAILTILCD